LVVQAYVTGISAIQGTVNGQPMNVTAQNGLGCQPGGYVETLYYVNPPSGTDTVTLTVNTGGYIFYYGALVYSGVNQTNPIGSVYAQPPCNSSTNPSFNITTSAANSLVASMLFEPDNAVITSGTGQIQRYINTNGVNQTLEGDDRITGAAGTYTMSYSLGRSETVAFDAVEIKAAPCNTSTFTPLTTSTNTTTNTLTPTYTTTSTNTPAITFTNTATVTNTMTASPTGTPTESFTASSTPTQSLTNTFTNTATATCTGSPALMVFAGNGTPGAINGPVLSASFQNPAGLAMDNSGNIYVADQTSVREISGGVVSTLISGLSSSVGAVVYDGVSNSLYASETTAGNLVRISLTGTPVVYGVEGSINVEGLCMGSNALGHRCVYYSTVDSGISGSPYSISQYDTVTGTSGVVVGASALGFPIGLAFDPSRGPSGLLYYADESYGNINVVNVATGAVNVVAGTGSATAAAPPASSPALSVNLNGVTYLGIDPTTGNVYVVETSGELLDVLIPSTPPGIAQPPVNGYVMQRLAGIKNTAGYQAYPISPWSGNFNNPLGVVQDGSGNLYIGDEGNHVVREIERCYLFPTNTPTGIATSTVINTSTNTLTNTPTSTSTNTVTNTVTSTITNTPTLTWTKTFTSTYSPTPLPTNTPTSTSTSSISPCGVQFVTANWSFSTSQSITFSVNVSGTNPLLIVQVYETGLSAVQGTVNGLPMNVVAQNGLGCQPGGYVETLYYMNPPSGKATVLLTANTAGYATYYGAMVYSGVNPASPIGSTYMQPPCNGSTSPSFNLTTVGANSIIASMIVEPDNAIITPGNGQTQRYIVTNGTNQTTEGDDRTTGAVGTYTMSYNLARSEYVAFDAVEIEAAPCNTSTPTPLYTSTNTATRTPTYTFTWTNTPTVTNTYSSTGTPTGTATNSLTATSTPTATVTLTNTVTNTITQTATVTWTATATNTPTITNTATVTLTNTVTNTITQTATSTWTATATNTPTLTNTATHTPSYTVTSTMTATATSTYTGTPLPCGVQMVSKESGITGSMTPSFPVTVSGSNTLVVIHVFCTTNTTNVTGAIGGNNMNQVNRFGAGCGGFPGDYECALYYAGLESGIYTVNLTDAGGNNFSTYYEAVVYSNVNQVNPVGKLAANIACQSTTNPGYSFGTSVSNSMISGMLVTTNHPVLTTGSGQSVVLTQTDGSSLFTQETDDQLTTSTGNYTMAYTSSPGEYYFYEALEVEPAPCSQAVVKMNAEVYEGKGTPTVTPTNTASVTEPKTDTPSATPTVSNTSTVSSLLQSVVAGPNVSRNGEPIKFMVSLGSSATIQLNLYSLTGEEVYSETVQGNVGMNILLWLLRNKGQVPVSSGLYVFTLQVNDGYEIVTKIGKVVVFH
jgi:hypothetical protein